MTAIAVDAVGTQAQDAPVADTEPRFLPPDIQSMAFWETVFPSAMRIFVQQNPEPDRRAGTPHSIRSSTDWDQVFQRLLTCRNEYTDDTGWQRKVRRKWRQFADNIVPAQQIWQYIPDISYITPVKGTVELLLEVIWNNYGLRRRFRQELTRRNYIRQ
jgi:hypothetical protein